MTCAKLLLGLEDAVLAVAKKDQERRPRMSNLAAQLQSDRPARARDQHAAVGQIARGANRSDDLRPPQQVRDVDLTKPLNTHPPVEQFEHPRHGAGRNAGTGTHLGDGTDRGARSAGHRDNHVLDRIRFDRPRQIFDPAEHAHAINALPLLDRVVVEHADRFEPEVVVAFEFTQDRRTGVAGADDEHAAPRTGT